MFTIVSNSKKTCHDTDTDTVKPQYHDAVQAILDESGLQDVILNSRILRCFQNKLTQLLQKKRIASRKGGKQMQTFLKTLLESKPYRFTYFLHETDKLKLYTKNKALTTEKEGLQKKLDAQTKKSDDLEHEVKKANASVLYWQTRFRNVVKRMISQQRDQPKKKYARRSLASYSERSKYRIKKELKSEITSALEFIGLYDLVPSKVTYYDTVENVSETIILLDEDEINKTFFDPDIENDIRDTSDLDDVYMLLYIKDKFNISNKAWHELASVSKGLPTTYNLRQRFEHLNKSWNIYPTPNSTEGVQVKLRDVLEEQVRRLIKSRQIVDGETINIKISGDGTNVGKRLQLLNVTFSIINEGSIAASEKGNYVLLIAKTKDDYKGIKNCMRDLHLEMKNLNSVTVDGLLFPVTLFLGGDWKFLATVCGIGPANQDYACIWCLCPRIARHDVSKEWPLMDIANNSRTIAKINEDMKGKKHNCVNPPIFEFIELDHVIIDTLHLFLRVCDILIDNLIRQLRKEDACEKTTFKSGFNVGKFHHMQKFWELLNSLGIPFKFYVNNATQKLEYRSLNGPEKLLLFEKINVNELLGNLPSAHLINKLWKNFLGLYIKLRKTYKNEEEIHQLKREITIWTQDFLHIYQSSHITPYMHAFRCHVPDFLKLYGNIGNFNQQGLEKYNDIVSKDYFRSSNHRGVEALKQIMLKKNRIQHLEAKGAERVKNSYLCSNCKMQGHSIKKCTEKCSSCDAQICCAHLLKINGKWSKKCLVTR